MVGVSLGITGPGASLGVHYRNAYQLMPKTLGGEPVRYVILDDGSDPTSAAQRAQADRGGEVRRDHGHLRRAFGARDGAGGEGDEDPDDRADADLARRGTNPWIFTVAQPTQLMVDAVVDRMKQNGVKTVGYIGFSDAWGDLVYNALMKAAPGAGIQGRQQRALCARRHSR